MNGARIVLIKAIQESGVRIVRGANRAITGIIERCDLI